MQGKHDGVKLGPGEAPGSTSMYGGDNYCLTHTSSLRANNSYGAHRCVNGLTFNPLSSQ